jgi:hypothetical protein
MLVKVKLSKIVEALSLLRSDWQSYLDPETGEVVTVTDDEFAMIEDGEDEEDLPDWQREMMPKLREAIESDRFLPLPDSLDIYEWSIMVRFAQHRSSDQQCQELLEALHGTGAFRMFRATIHRMGIEKDWDSFRDETLEEIAKGWLEEHGVPYE